MLRLKLIHVSKRGPCWYVDVAGRSIDSLDYQAQVQPGDSLAQKLLIEGHDANMSAFEDKLTHVSMENSRVQVTWNI